VWSHDIQSNLLNDIVAKLSPVKTEQGMMFITNTYKKATSLNVILVQLKESQTPRSQLIRKLIQRYMVPPPSWFSLPAEEWKSNIVSAVCPKVLGVLVQIIPTLEDIPTGIDNVLT
jgi:hypothetical protein